KASRVRVFEVGRVFLRDASVPDSDTTVAGFHQPMRVAGMAYGSVNALQWGQKDTASDFYDVKGDVEALLAQQDVRFEPVQHPALHPGRAAAVLLNGQPIGVLGELHPRWRQAYDLPQAPVLFELDWEAVLGRQVPKFAPVAKNQFVERDIAVIVKESVTHDQLLAAVQAAPTQGMLRHATVFDIFRANPKAAASSNWLGEDEKSVAIRLQFLNEQAGLTDEVIETLRQAVLAQLASDVQARLRG
ncbi:MAG: phenylalanine--tRNA ligase subunit beta, partial [Brachymonas sp.]|nr:phenylalanine--tRNA ligase subunit beta [Brachymonas sp.]